MKCTKKEVYISDVEKEIHKFEQEAPSKNSSNTFVRVKKALLDYDLRLDSIKLDLEISPKGLNKFEPLNDSNLYVSLREQGIKISKSDFREILKSDFVPKVNPIDNYFKQLKSYKPEEPDYIDKLANFVQAENQGEFNKQFKKHLVRTVKCALDDDYFNKQAFILVQAGQNTGKTTFCRFLTPPTLKDYFAEDITTDKDGLILLAKNFIINLDELSTLHKAEINALKSYFSKTSINVRLPYEAKNSNIVRRCSFIGSTNLGQFLSDETGSVRWLCFQINSINWEYKLSINIDDVWRQAFYLYQSQFPCDLSQREIQENEIRNSQFQMLSVEDELIHKYLDAPNSTNDHQKEFLQASEITTYLKVNSGISKINHVQMGKVLSKYYQRDKRVKNGIQVYGYWVVKSLNF
jgi:predicted P-loop ATPase